MNGENEIDLSTRDLVEAAAKRDPEPLVIAGRRFASRLFVGTGKFSSAAVMGRVVRQSATEMVTVALRRIDLSEDVTEQDPVSVLDRNRIVLLPNTSGARDAEEAIRLARLARSMGAGDWVKLEVTPDPVYLLPDPVETLKAAAALVKEGFHVLPYIHADPVLALHLQDAGCVTVMPLGSPIGTNQGIRTKESLRIIIEQARVPVVVDAGLGAPSHACEALEMGAHAVLVNTALAVSRDPVRAAAAFALAVVAGRDAYLHGVRGSVDAPAGETAPNSKASESAAQGDTKADAKGEWKQASASSPLTGFLND